VPRTWRSFIQDDAVIDGSHFFRRLAYFPRRSGAPGRSVEESHDSFEITPVKQLGVAVNQRCYLFDVAHLVSVASEDIYTSGHSNRKGHPPGIPERKSANGAEGDGKQEPVGPSPVRILSPQRLPDLKIAVLGLGALIGAISSHSSPRPQILTATVSSRATSTAR